VLLSVIIIILLILVSGVLSSLEIALSSSNRNKVKMLAEKGDVKAARLLATIEDPHNFFATTQLYITFIAFFCGAYAASSFTEPLVGWISHVGLRISESVAEPLVFILITFVLTYVALVFGELVPKRIAMQYAIPFAAGALPYLKVLSVLALPIVKLLSVSSKLVLKLLRVKDKTPDEHATKEEISLIVESSSEHGHIAVTEQGMIENIFNIDKLTAGDICTHRVDVFALPLDADNDAILDMLADEFYTRVPVYEDSLDKICGILYTKDVIRFMASNPDLSGFDMKTMLREPHFVSLSKKIDELYQEMRQERIYMVVVIDEHGGTMGILSMEDLVEKIVGSIHDEYDVDELPDIVSISDNVFRVQGTTALEEVQDFFGITLPVDEFDTLSGFLVGQIGHIPSEDESLEIAWESLLFKVESIHEKRIETVVAVMGDSVGV